GYCRIGAPERWTAFEETLRLVRQMPEVRLPAETKTMVLVEPSSHAALPITEMGSHAEFPTCFDFLGSHAQSWFKFVHGGQLERGEVSLSDYRIIYLPMAKYFKSSLAGQILEFANNGGTVICADPEVFSFASDKDKLPPDARQILGLEVEPVTVTRSRMTIVDNTFFPSLPTSESFMLSKEVQSYRGKGDGSWKTLATFEDGTPAIARKTLGKGFWIQFAFQPFQPKLLETPELRALFKSLQQYLGEPTDLDIWRFRFPTPENLPQPPEGKCLTGNAVFWKQNEPVSVGGDGVKGKTVWTKNPVGVSQSEIAFETSRLFDRRKAVQAPNDKTHAAACQNWAYQWNGTEAFD
ncbi:MAG TPA: beta-galactosidase trimerization domain-containing protein, partial [bacterium]|nr:beta-galactosidase trimerization domain-containing protein [bacterium]